MQHAHGLEMEQVGSFGGERIDSRFRLNWSFSSPQFYYICALCNLGIIYLSGVVVGEWSRVAQYCRAPSERTRDTTHDKR